MKNNLNALGGASQQVDLFLKQLEDKDKPMPKEYNWRKYDPDSSWYMEGDTTFAKPPKARGRRFSRQYKKDKKWRKE